MPRGDEDADFSIGLSLAYSGDKAQIVLRNPTITNRNLRPTLLKLLVGPAARHLKLRQRIAKIWRRARDRGNSAVPDTGPHLPSQHTRRLSRRLIEMTLRDGLVRLSRIAPMQLAHGAAAMLVEVQLDVIYIASPQSVWCYRCRLSDPDPSTHQQPWHRRGGGVRHRQR
jgi:hypothetical protein